MISNIHAITAQPTIILYTYLVRWLIVFVNTPTYSFRVVNQAVIAYCEPDTIMHMSTLKDPHTLFPMVFGVEHENKFNFIELVKIWFVY